MSLLLEEIKHRLKDASYDAGAEHYPLTDDAVRVFVKPNCVPVTEAMKGIQSIVRERGVKIYAGHNNHIYIEEVKEAQPYYHARKLHS